MKKIIYTAFLSFLLIASLTFFSCDDEVTPSLYETLPPVGELPVKMFFNFDENIHGLPYAITCQNTDEVYVSVGGLGIKKILKTPKDSLASYAPKGGETFFNSLTFGSDGNIYAARRVRGIFQIAENTSPAAFVASAQGLEDNINDVEFDNSKNILWAGGNTGIIYSVSLSKTVNRFYSSIGNISAIKPTQNNLYVAARDTSNKEIIWRFPIISADSLGDAEMFFNFSNSVDSLARINDIAVAEDGEVFVFTDTEKYNVISVNSDKSFRKAFYGLITGKVYSFTWGTDNFAYFSNVIGEKNSDVWKINMGKNRAP